MLGHPCDINTLQGSLRVYGLSTWHTPELYRAVREYNDMGRGFAVEVYMSPATDNATLMNEMTINGYSDAVMVLWDEVREGGQGSQ